MKAFLIDTPNKQVIEVDYDGNYKSIYKHIKAEMFCTVLLNEEADTLFVDDEGLINGNPHGWIKLKNNPQPLRGYGLVLGTDDEGESVAPRITLEELRALVSFPEEDALGDPEEYAHIEVTGYKTAEEMLEALFGTRIP